MLDSTRILSQAEDGTAREDRELEWEADEREVLLQAWQAFRRKRRDKGQKWSHELIEEERRDWC